MNTENVFAKAARDAAGWCDKRNAMQRSNRIERFEDLLAWQKARELNRCILEVTNRDPFARDFPLRDQIRRASLSIMSNIAEGFERGGRSEFHQFLVIAKGSCAEVRSQAYAALDADYLGQEQFERIMRMTEEVGRLIGGLRAAVRRQRDSAT